MTSDQNARTPMFVDEPDTGLVIADLRRYNQFTAVFFVGREARLHRKLAELSGVRTGQDALDIGCGPGKLVRALGLAAGPTGSVTGVDPSEYAIDHNQRRDQVHRYLRSAAQQLDLPDAAFDVVTSTFVMHHIPERHRESALVEMWRVLRPGGRLLLADAFPAAPVRALFTWARRIRRKSPADPFGAVDVRHYSESLRAIGFCDPEFAAVGYNTGVLTAVKP